MKALVIDIGRTHIRYGNVDDGKLMGAYRRPTRPSNFANLVRQLAGEFDWWNLDEIAVVVGAPGPYVGTKFTGLNMPGWSFLDVAELQTQIPHLKVVHDVIGGVHAAKMREESLPILRGERITHTPERERSPLGFIQTGIGLGVSALLPLAQEQWLAVSGEGGSALLQAQHEDDEALLRYFLDHPDEWQSPTAQAVLSTESIGQYAHALGGEYAEWDSGLIFEAARKGDVDCERATLAYARLLGQFAATVALMFRAYDGLVIGGYLPARLSERAKATFGEYFLMRGSASEQLREIPILVVEEEYNTLVGLAYLAQASALED